MADQGYAIATLFVAAGAYLRGALVLLLAVRTFLGRRGFATLRIDKVQFKGNPQYIAATLVDLVPTSLVP